MTTVVFLGVAVPEPYGDLGSVGGDHERHDAAALGEDDGVDHEHGHVELGQVPGEQLRQRRQLRP